VFTLLIAATLIVLDLVFVSCQTMSVFEVEPHKTRIINRKFHYTLLFSGVAVQHYGEG